MSRRKAITKPSVDVKESYNEGGSGSIAAQTFTFRGLAAATKNFRADCLLREGGFGKVFLRCRLNVTIGDNSATFLATLYDNVVEKPLKHRTPLKISTRNQTYSEGGKRKGTRKRNQSPEEEVHRQHNKIYHPGIYSGRHKQRGPFASNSWNINNNSSDITNGNLRKQTPGLRSGKQHGNPAQQPSEENQAQADIKAVADNGKDWQHILGNELMLLNTYTMYRSKTNAEQ